MTELTTVWSGSHKHVYLCVHEPELRLVMRPVIVRVVVPVPVIPSKPRPRRNHGAVRAEAMRLLASQPHWRIRDLRRALKADRDVLREILRGWREQVLITRLRRGVIALARPA